jgi:beta-barrel assembly-enhancing protease
LTFPLPSKLSVAQIKLKALLTRWTLVLSDSDIPVGARQFLDGLTSRTHWVTLSPRSDGLAFSSLDIERLWPWESLVWADRAAFRITSTTDDDARLVLEPDDVQRLVAGAPQLASASGQSALAKLVAGLTIAAGAVFALVFFGIPAAAVPLAKATPASLEEQLGQSVEAQLRLALKTCQAPNDIGRAALQRVAQEISANADLRFPIDVRVTNVPIINAFALPGGKIWVTRGLIREAETPEELAAVLSHEIAHVENRDVLVAVYRALGFGLILDAVVGGGSGAGQQLVMLGANVTDMKHSRDVEARSDRRGMELLNEAGLDSRGMAVFFQRLAKMEGESKIGELTAFVSSHPQSDGRAAIVAQRAKAGRPAMTPQEWASLKQVCHALDKK